MLNRQFSQKIPKIVHTNPNKLKTNPKNDCIFSEERL